MVEFSKFVEVHIPGLPRITKRECAPDPEQVEGRGTIQSVKSVESVVKPFALFAKFAVCNDRGDRDSSGPQEFGDCHGHAGLAMTFSVLILLKKKAPRHFA